MIGWLYWISSLVWRRGLARQVGSPTLSSVYNGILYAVIKEGLSSLRFQFELLTLRFQSGKI